MESLQRRFWRWFDRRHPPRADAVVLSRRRLYILPSGYGYVFGLMLCVLFLWSINYNSSMGFVLTFWLAAMALNVMWRTHANLLGLRVAPAGADPVFAGQQAGFRCILDNPGHGVRYGIALHAEGSAVAYADVPAQGSAVLVLALPARRRGWLR
ncbi:MAG TPA: DUF58 domain-containing protein, partial [Candidatus Competibacteraceae bacterium]|nr:DUF58 domain-containing protein [Candidatus Competibacteraceae bacterium]